MALYGLGQNIPAGELARRARLAAAQAARTGVTPTTITYLGRQVAVPPMPTPAAPPAYSPPPPPPGGGYASGPTREVDVPPEPEPPAAYEPPPYESQPEPEPEPTREPQADLLPGQDDMTPTEIAEYLAGGPPAPPPRKSLFSSFPVVAGVNLGAAGLAVGVLWLVGKRR
jgi:hypothetical protein